MDSRFVPHVLYGLYPQTRKAGKAGEAGEAIRAPLVSANRKPAKLNPPPNPAYTRVGKNGRSP
jgi:hypothetical protein